MAKNQPIDESVKAAPATQDKPFDFENFECKTLEDFKLYNHHVRLYNRGINNDLKKMRVKVPDESFYPKRTVKFQRFDQPENVLKVWVRNKDIDWKGQLKPGCTYELPLPVVKFLNKLAVPIFAEVEVRDGGETKTETKQIGERNRFSCQEVFAE